MPVFTEIQRFRQWWLWLIIVASIFISLGVLLVDGFQSFDLIPLSIPFILAVVIYITRLDTRVDELGIHYRFFPLTGWRTLAWTDVQQAAVRPYSFVGYGIRWDFDTWYYVIDGQWGLHIDRSNGKSLVIGTQRPDELRQSLLNFHPAIAG